jgi:hypothetical protein
MSGGRNLRAVLPALALALAAGGAAPAPGRLHREATSSAESWKTKDGRRMTHTVNRRFTFAEVHPERYGGNALLLEETFDRLLDSGAEGEKSSVEVSATTVAGKRAWAFRTAGAAGEAREDNIYRVDRPGCCGARDLSVFFSLLDGRELFDSDTPILAIDVPNSSLKRFAGYHDVMAASPPTESEKNSRVVGALSYGSDRAPAKRILVIAAEPKSDENGAVKKLTIVSAGKEVEEDRFDLWSADKSADPGKIGGFAIRARAFTEPDILFEIPVEGDRLAIEKATLGKGITLEEAK